jgi:gliding motility-associated-like protein
MAAPAAPLIPPLFLSPQQPTLSLNANSFNICGSQSASIIAGGPGTFSWSNGATTSSVIVTPTVTTVYTVVVTNVCGSVAQTATVTPGAAPAFTISSASSVICQGQTLTLNTAGSSGTFTWSGPGIVGSASGGSVLVSQAGVYTSTLTNGCGTATSSFTVTDGPSSALILAASSATLCSGGSVTLTSVATGSVNWSTGALNTPSVTVTNTGVVTATLVNSCGTSSSSITIVNGAAPALTIVPSATALCSGQNATLTANGSAGTYSWINGPSGNIITTGSSGVYTAVVTNSCGTGTASYSLVFQSVPAVSLTSSKNVLCPNENATLTANGLNGGNSYSWSSSANSANTETVSLPGKYIVTYTNGCGAVSDSLNITASIVSADFIFSPGGGNAPVSVTFTNTSVNTSSLQWNFGSGQTASGSVETVPFSTAGIYTISLLVLNSDGCQASVSKTLEITSQELGIIPEVLTPNGDGKNDLFEIKGIENYPENDLVIFNRWGNQVYKMKGYRNTWEGSRGSGNDKLPSGTYFFILKLNDASNSVFRGYVQLMY